MEITKELSLDEKQNHILDLHSFINVLNVLISELYLLQMDLPKSKHIEDAISLVLHFSEKIKDKNTVKETLEDAKNVMNDIIESLDKATEGKSLSAENTESVDNIHSIFKIFEVRTREMLARIDDEQKWELHDIEKLKNNFLNVFHAIEKNSKGRYRIIYNIAEHDIQDYFVQLDIKSEDDKGILMPPVFQDVMRDLIANSRKYTDPGGRIMAGLVNDGNMLKFAVEDTGRGIPSDQMDKVIDFGFRAYNVADKSTKGGGFGLTKAYWVTKKFGGRMFIESELNKGTLIKIEIPVK